MFHVCVGMVPVSVWLPLVVGVGKLVRVPTSIAITSFPLIIFFIGVIGASIVRLLVVIVLLAGPIWPMRPQSQHTTPFLFPFGRYSRQGVEFFAVG